MLQRVFLGGLVGLGVPLALFAGNEFLFIKKQIDGGTKLGNAVQICAFDRRWFPLYPKIIHAPGCRNQTVDGAINILLISTIAGSAIGAMSTRRVAIPADITDQNRDASYDPNQVAPQSYVSDVENPSQDLNQRSNRLSTLLQKRQWTFLGKGLAVAGSLVLAGTLLFRVFGDSKGGMRNNSCTAKILAGKSPSAHYPSGKTMQFYQKETLDDGITLIGERMLRVPLKNLSDVSVFCENLPEYYENDAPPAALASRANLGVSTEKLEELCRYASMLDNPRRYLDALIQGRYAAGNSTIEEYRNQKNWMINNCPSY